MDRDTAERIVKAIEDLTPGLNTLDVLSEQITDEEERREFRRKLGNIMILTGFDLLMPIVKQFPDLDPDK